MGTTPAYADAENPGVTSDNASEVAVGASQDKQAVSDVSAAPIASSEDVSMPTVDTDIAPSSEEVTAPDAGGDAPVAPAPAIAQGNSDESAGDAILGPTDDPVYPGDDGTADVYIGLAPAPSVSYSVDSATIDPITHAVHVYLNSQVGMGVDLQVAIEYIRIGDTVYDARTSGFVTVQLPSSETDAYTTTYFKEGLMFTWYANGTPLGQGTYYSDPATNPALGGSTATAGSDLTKYTDVALEDFMSDKTTLWGVDSSMFMGGSPIVFYKDVPYAYSDSFDGSVELLSYSMIGAGNSDRYVRSPLFFESPGERTVVAQFTYMQDYRSKNTENEYVGLVLYASNPVVFHIGVAESAVMPAAMTVVAHDASTGDTIDINNGEFIVELEKDYLNEYEAVDPMSGSYEWLRYSHCSMSGDTYPVTTPGMYRLTVTHVTNLYEQYTECFLLDEALISSGAFSRHINLVAHVPSVQYSVTFYQEDGVTVIPVSGTDETGTYVTRDSWTYNEGTVAEYVRRPDHPTKADTDAAKYVFKEWKAVPAGEGAIDTSGWSYDYVYPVTGDTKYIAVFRTIPLKNNAGQRIVYATGGLFSWDALPTGVLSYELTSSPLTASEASNVIASHSSMMSEETVLGMVKVDLTQYNDDPEYTTTNVTEHEGLEGMKLKFNMEEAGINAKDGDKLKILQIHQKDESSAEEIIEHKATVVNGEVEIELNGKLSTFVFMMDDTATGGEGTEGGSADPEGGSTTGEGDSGESGGTPGEGGSQGEAGSGEEPSGAPAVDSLADVDAAYAQTSDAAASGVNESAQAHNAHGEAKSASAAIASSMPATGDSMSALVIALVALSELIAAIAICVSVRRRAQL
ncbi:hypothetical protein [Denitrobacterium detoxificans]|uniref:hypothetical protein n=1 Tax=Denitrobacterium detoxificans TaxID=79604 RepID=UPI0026E9B7AB|nr:hypothetical protein [Denitrobacterium detoxificans]